MKYQKLCDLVFEKLKNRMESSAGLAVCARHRSKFEAWLKVELCGVLAECDENLIIPEKDRVDISFGDWRIELKTINTSYVFNNVVKKTKCITTNVGSLISDIEKLRNKLTRSKQKNGVVFVVFPVMHEIPNWQSIHLPKISKELKKIDYKEFVFKNKIPGVIYIGLV